jgi:CRISPR system Cascade subunit CasE
MFLSRIEMDTRRRETVRALASPHVLHAAVESCFYEKSDGAERKLWRTDYLNDKLYLLLLSPQAPSFSAFSTQFCEEGKQGETKSYSAFLARVQEGQQWRFRLRANPVHSTRDGLKTGERGRLYAHVTTEQQKNWLSQKAPSCGFAVDGKAYDIVQTEQIRFRRQGKFVTLGVAVFEGILQVTDLALFSDSLTGGIGRAKAYGCGLLTIAGRS